MSFGDKCVFYIEKMDLHCEKFPRKISYRNELHRKSILYKRSDSSDRSLIYKSSTSFLGVWSFLDKRCVWRDRSLIEDRCPVQLLSIRDFSLEIFHSGDPSILYKGLVFRWNLFLNETFLNNFLTVEVDLKINYWCKASMSPTGARILGWPVGTLKFLCLKYSRIMHVILVGVGFIINMPEMCRNWLRYMVCLHCGSHIVLKITNKSELNMSKWLDVGSKIWIKQLWR